MSTRRPLALLSRNRVSEIAPGDFRISGFFTNTMGIRSCEKRPDEDRSTILLLLLLFFFFFLRPKQVASKHRRDSRRTSEIARAAEVVEAGGGEIGCGGRRQRFLVQPDRVPGAAIPVSLHS